MRTPAAIFGLTLAAGCAAPPAASPPAASPPQIAAATISTAPPASAPPVAATALPPASTPPIAATTPPSASAPPAAAASASVVVSPSPPSDHLDAAAIQRIIRQNSGRFRLCFENGLAPGANLGSRVTLRFVIGRDGGVSNVSNAGSALPDGEAVRCMVRAMYGLSFPQPKGAPVTVTYPLTFGPGGQ